MSVFNVAIFSSDHSMTRAFTALENFSSSCKKIFFDTIDTNPHLKKPRIGSVILGVKEVVSNTSAVMRQESSPTMSALGLTTGFSFFQGMFGLEKACHHYQAADLLHDTIGKQIAQADAVSRTGQTSGGALFVFVRIADVLVRGFNSHKNLIAPAATALSIGTHCFTALYAGLAALSFISLRESRGFSKKIEKAQETEEGLKTLIGELTGEGLPEIGKKISEKDVYGHLGLTLKSLFQEIDPKLAKGLSSKKLGEELLTQEKYRKFVPIVLDRMGVTADLKQVDVKSLQDNAQLIQRIWAREKQVVQERVVGARGKELLQKAQAMNLHTLVSNDATKEYGQAASKELLEKIQKCVKDQEFGMKAYFVGGVLGTVCSILGEFSAAPITTIAKFGFLVCVWAVAIGDTLGFWESYKAGGPIGEFPTPYVWFHFMVGIAAVIVASIFTKASGGIFSIACIAVIGSVWLTADLWVLLGLLPHFKEEQKKQHPTLEQFSKSLESHNLDWISKEALDMFHKLPKLSRETILQDLLNKHPDLMEVYAKACQVFGFDLKETLEVAGKNLHAKGQDPKIENEAFKQASNMIIEAGKPLDAKSIKDHPCSHVFYKALYNECAKEEQQKVLRRIGKDRLNAAVKKLLIIPV